MLVSLLISISFHILHYSRHCLTYYFNYLTNFINFDFNISDLVELVLPARGETIIYSNYFIVTEESSILEPKRLEVYSLQLTQEGDSFQPFLPRSNTSGGSTGIYVQNLKESYEISA